MHRIPSGWLTSLFLAVAISGLGDEPKCGVYYAPSTIPGAGYGIYAGRDFKEKEWVLPGDLVVPIVEMGWHNEDTEYHHLWEEYQWSERSFGGMDREGESASGASFGVGALPNCFHPFINLEETYTDLDWAGIHRSRDPGAGAFTPYHNRKTYAYRDIEAGMELFVDYGASYFPSREEIYGPIPGIKDYDYGDFILDNMMEMLAEVEWREELVKGEAVHIGDDESEAELETWRFGLHSDMLRTSREVGSIWKSRPLLTLPENATHVDYLLEKGIKYFHYNRSVRSLQWLEEYGLCTDNIKPDRSTVHQAGRGAFATRNIQRGEVVAPMPLLHIPNRSIYNMYGPITSSESRYHTVVRNTSDIVSAQLILNYCWGHSESTLLLCPYGAGASLINHPPSKEKANCKLVWSTKGSRHLEWLSQGIDEWGHVKHAGLALELIATQDIKEGTEVFVWYGDEWEEAWQKHIRTWQPPPGADQYEPAAILNERHDLVVRTIAEGSYDPEEDKILYCREAYRQFAGARSSSPYDFQTCRALDRYVGRDGEYHYLVETYSEIEGPSECWETGNFIIFDLPRDGFNFRDALYALDHSQGWAFRHSMMLDDELMPAAWRNLLSKGS